MPSWQPLSGLGWRCGKAVQVRTNSLFGSVAALVWSPPLVAAAITELPTRVRVDERAAAATVPEAPELQRPRLAPFTTDACGSR